jgi:hypothetical protein
MPEVSWAMVMREHPAAHLVVGDVPGEAARGLVRARVALLARLARALRLPIAAPTDAAKLAEAVGAMKTGRYPGWTSQRSFRFENAAADAIGVALARNGPAPPRRTRKRRTSGVL